MTTAPVATQPVDTTVDLAGLELAHPILNGSGTFDAVAALRTFGDELLRRFPFAAFVSKTITLEPRGGNPPPRLWEAPAGMINSIGLPNKGLKGFLAHDLEELASLPAPLITSVAGFSHEEFELLVDAVAERPEVAAIELNVSCPNVKSGCVMGSEPHETATLMERVRPLTRKPLIVKLTPNVADVGAIAVAAESGGADALALINTLRALAVDASTGRPWLGASSGGLSGPAIRAIALEMTYAASTRVNIPLVGMGGVGSGQDALDFIAAGATCVAVGTENFRDPAAAIRILSELVELTSKRGAGSIRDLVGSAHELRDAQQSL